MAETLLSLGLLALILSALSKIVASGFSHYRKSLGSLDVQRAALTVNKRLSDDLSLSNIETVEVEPGAIVFASPTDLSGKILYTSKGNIQWSSHIAYYLQTNNQTSLIIRKQALVGTPGQEPILPSTDGHGIAWFKGQTGGSVVAKDVVELDFVRQADLVNVSVTGSTENRGEFEMIIENTVFPRN